MSWFMQIQSSSSKIQSVTPSEAFELAKQGHVILDVRSPAEYRTIHACDAVCVELSRIKEHPGMLSEFSNEGEPVIFTCHSGKRAMEAAQLAAEDLSCPVYVVKGGTEAWSSEGLPVERGKGTISLERQVRIAAGSLVAVGTALGILLSPWFLALPLFVGAGLVFAGVTDNCGMALVLARMPWNR